MVNNFSGLQFPTKNLLGHNPVFVPAIPFRVGYAFTGVEVGFPDLCPGFGCHPPGIQLLV